MNRMTVDSQHPQPASRSQTKPKDASKSSSTSTQRRTFATNRNHTRGQKRRFGLAGVTNVLLTNLVLQILLASSVVGVTTATLISQLVNTCMGYAIYGKMVFQAKGLRHHRPLLRYLLLMTAMWLINAAGIAGAEILGINKNLAAAGLIPLLAMLSFIGQKHWVFR